MIQFGDTLQNLFIVFFISYTAYGLVFLEMVYFSDTNIPVCICLEDIPQVVFMLLPHLSDLKLLIVFKLFLQWGTCSIRSCFYANRNQSPTLPIVVSMHTTPTLE